MPLPGHFLPPRFQKWDAREEFVNDHWSIVIGDLFGPYRPGALNGQMTNGH
jgi:hypothetical protein